MSDKVAERLTAFARLLGVANTEVVSLKFRPVMPGAQYTDPFGKSDANAYLYPSEYAAGKQAVTLVMAPQTLGEAVAKTCDHPTPWSGDYKDFISQLQGTTPPVLWVQHETGLEILAAVASVATIISLAIQIWDVTRKKIEENQQAQESDRYWKQVTEVREEIRYIDRQGQLVQRLVHTQQVTVSISPTLAQSCKWVP
jgi:hypothetical protein